MPYRKSHIKARLDRAKPKKSLLIKGWFWLVVLVIAIISAVCYFALFCSRVQIENIIITGNQETSREAIEAVIIDNINHKILGLGSWGISSKSILLASPGKLEEAILEKFAVIDNVIVSKKFFQTITVDVSERKPVAVFCPSLDVSISGDSCYFLDNNGIIFNNLGLSQSEYLIVRQNVGTPVSAGQQALDPNIISAIVEIDKTLKNNLQTGVKNALFASNSKITIITLENWYIYFGYGNNYNSTEQIAKLNSLLEKGISAQEKENLRYIDLRPEDRAIFCDNKTCGG